MKKFLLFIFVASFFVSCTDDEITFLNECDQVADGFFELYDPYKAYMDIYEEQVNSGEIEDNESRRLDYIYNDPERRYQKVADYVDANYHRCEAFQSWGRGRMEKYR